VVDRQALDVACLVDLLEVGVALVGALRASVEGHKDVACQVVVDLTSDQPCQAYHVGDLALDLSCQAYPCKDGLEAGVPDAHHAV
jgi:hypothetical protein